MDLLNTLGSKETKAKESSSAASSGEAIIGTNSESDNHRRGADLIGQVAKKETVETAPVVETVVTEDKTVKDADSWTKESALKEMLKLREEAKATRLKFQEQLERVQSETESKIAKISSEAQDALEAKKKLETLEAEAADKKRSIEEKLANREAKLSETELIYKQKLQDKEKEVEAYKNKALQFEAQEEAKKAIYKEKLKEEIDKVPEDLREFAEKMVKGYDDPHDAWVAISEAHRKNLFGEKKVMVNHSVPGANDGARLSKAKMEEAERDARKKSTPRDLIKKGLEKIKQGESNSAFRVR
jgi:delta 1-pyrroline-5-carboxylate dehydrogenase